MSILRLPFRKPALIPALFMACATVLLTGLGLWQVERLQWKQHEIAKVEAAQALPILGTLPQELGGLEYRKVMLTGTFLYDKAMHMVGRPRQFTSDSAGFFIVTPFKLDDDGRIILVNRGFAPAGKETKPEGVQSVAGIIRPARVKRYFSPDNQPDKNLWFYEDITAMSAATGVTLTPLIVEATGDMQKDVYPIPHDGNVSLRNDHLQYAITWFSLAIIGLVMFGVYQRKH